MVDITTKSREDETKWINVARNSGRSLAVVVREIMANQGFTLVAATDPKHKYKNYRMLEAVSQVVFDKALSGDLTACQMVLDRLAGKPRQEIDVTAMTSHEDALKVLEGEV
jgi:hypothetical protein